MLSNFRFLKGTLTGVLFFCSFEILAQNWQDLQWQRLLLYRATLLGYESEADHDSYFSSPRGKFSPSEELKAFLESVDDQSPDPRQNVFCRFPARLRWLKKFRNLPKPKVECEDYQKYLDLLRAKSISVVFSSYYLNNPGSSFGHTFIRLGKHSDSNSDNTTATELLDTGINYGAMTEGAGPVLFAIGGLAGWFSGNYNAVPYYYKVREYNDYETRDLWTYQLDMTQEEIDMVVDIIWELAHSKFDYYFLTENCSYHVLSILEAARPSLKLHDYLPRLYTIPSETLKALQASGIVWKISFRPSASTQFYHHLSFLNVDEKKAVNEIVFKGETTQQFSEKKKAFIYDTALSLVDYKFAKEVLKGDEKVQKLKRPLLVARSKIPLRSEAQDFTYLMNRAPHFGHGQKRVAISYMKSGSRNLLDTEWRFAFHDFLDKDTGFPPRTKLEVMKGQLRTDGHHHQLRDFSVLDVMTLGQWDTFNYAPSWKIKIGQTQTRYEGEDLTTVGFSGGYGYSVQIGRFAPYLLAHIENAYVFETLHKYKLGYGADVGLLTDINDEWKLLNLLEARAYPWNQSKFSHEVRYSNQFFGFGAFTNTFLRDGVKELGLSFFKYI
jgi:hypothetical protein